MQLEVLEAQRRVLGAEHLSLATTGDLAGSLSCQGNYTEAERMLREVLDAQSRILGAEHPMTLATTSDLAGSLSHQGKYA